MSLNGLNPFSLVTDVETNGVNVEELKRTGRLLDIAKEGKWLINHMRAEYDAKAGRCFEPVLSQKLASEQLLPGISLQQQIQLSDAIRGQLVQRLRDQAVQKLCFGFMQERFARSLGNSFDSSLQTVPDERDLDVIIVILESDVNDSSKVLPSNQADVVGSEITSTSTGESQSKASTAGINSSATATPNIATPLASGSSRALRRERGYKV